MRALNALPDAGQVLPAVGVGFADRARNDFSGLAREILLLRRGLGGRPAVFLLVRLSLQKVLDIDESGAGVAEGLDRLALAEPVHLKPFLAQSLCEPREVAVGAHQHDPVEGALVHEAHGVDHQCDVGGVLSLRVAALLMLQDGERLDCLVPAGESGPREIAVDAPHVGFAQLDDLVEDRLGVLRAGVVDVDQDREALCCPGFRHWLSLRAPLPGLNPRRMWIKVAGDSYGLAAARAKPRRPFRLPGPPFPSDSGYRRRCSTDRQCPLVGKLYASEIYLIPCTRCIGLHSAVVI